MMHRMLLLATTVLAALMAGLFYSWSCSVIPGLARVPDTVYLSAMYAFNRAIQNPLFFVGFLGTAILLPFCAWNSGPQRGLVLGALACYWVGVMGVTMLGNVPLNNLLNRAAPTAVSTEEMAQLRRSFEGPWVRLHSVRTCASFITLVLLVLACLRYTPPARP